MKCKFKGCRRRAAPKRKECETCRSQNKRKRHPMRYCFQTLKDNAKRRGKKFELTYDQFSVFAIKNKLLMGKGRTAESYTVDRIRNWEGYHIDNIQRLTLAQNASKGSRKLEYDYRTGYATYTSPQENNDIETPF